MNIIIGVFGSIGDLLPMTAVGEHLASDGHSVIYLTNPTLAYAARRLGIRNVRKLGTPDTSLLQLGAFDALEQYRRTFALIARDLALTEVHAEIGEVLADLRPDVALLHPFACALRAALTLRGTPMVDINIYPSLFKETSPIPPAPFHLEGGEFFFAERSQFDDVAGPLQDAYSRRVADVAGAPGSAFGDHRTVALPEALWPTGSVGWPLAGSVLGGSGSAASPRSAVLTFGTLFGLSPVNFVSVLDQMRDANVTGVTVVGCPQSVRAEVAKHPAVGEVLDRWAPLGDLLSDESLLVSHGGINAIAVAAERNAVHIAVPMGMDTAWNALMMKQGGAGAYSDMGSFRAVLESELWSRTSERAVTTVQQGQGPSNAAAVLAEATIASGLGGPTTRLHSGRPTRRSHRT